VYKLVYSFLLGTAKRYIKDHEEAVFQMNTGFATAMCKLDKYDTGSSFVSWIHRVVVNSIIDFLRKKKRYKEHMENYKDNLSNVGPSLIQNNSGLQKLEYEDLLQLLNHLPDVTKEVFNLYVIDGFKHDEISKMINMSTGTTKWHVAKARTILTEVIRQKQELTDIYIPHENSKKQML